MINAAQKIFRGGSALAAAYRTHPWQSTPLGPVEGWPISLRTLVAAMFESPAPMLVSWGCQPVHLYNDAFHELIRPGTSANIDPSGCAVWGEDWQTVDETIRRVISDERAIDCRIHSPMPTDPEVKREGWLCNWSPVRDDQGAVRGAMLTLGDAIPETEMGRGRHFDRDRIQELFRNAPTFMAVLHGADHVFDLMNDEYRKLIGFRDIVGLPVRQALPELEGQGFFELLDNVLETGEPFVGTAMPVRLQAGVEAPFEDRFVNFVYQPIMEEDGSCSGIFVQGVDVTEVIESRTQAESANRSKMDFLGVMSHEIRTPLNAIEGYAELLRMEIYGPLNEKQMDSINRIIRSERHLLGLISDMLNFAQLEAGTVVFDILPIVLADTIATCDALIQSQCNEKKIEYGVKNCVKRQVLADPDRLRQILINLLTNALKYSEPGGTLDVHCEEDGDRVRIDITDTGRGIHPEQLEHIFNPFVQLDTAGSGAAGGVGLGLAICRDLARGMGGSLSVTSEVGEGSTFSLHLPLVAEVVSQSYESRRISSNGEPRMAST